MESKTLLKNINSIIQIERRKQNLSLRQLSSKCAVDYSFLSRIEHGYIASEEVYENLCKGLNINLKEIEERLNMENKHLIANLTAWCRLEKLTKYDVEIECIDSIINNLLFDLQESVCSSFKNAKPEYKLSNDSYDAFDMLESCFDTMSDEQKQAYILLYQYYLLANNQYNKIDILKKSNVAITKYKNISPFFDLIDALDSYYNKEYVRAITSLFTLKTTMTHCNYLTWNIIIDMLIVSICKEVNDYKTMTAYLEGLSKLYSDNLFISDVLKELLVNNKQESSL